MPFESNNLTKIFPPVPVLSSKSSVARLSAYLVSGDSRVVTPLTCWELAMP